MTFHGRIALGRVLAPAALLFACGCTLTPLVAPRPAAPAGAPAQHTAAAAPAGAGAPANGSAPGNGAAAPTAPGAAPAVAPAGGVAPAPILPLNLTPPESPQDAISLLSQRLAANDDERKVLAARLAQIELVLREKEKALDEAREEITGATNEIAKARAELRAYKQQVEELREKLRAAEKKNDELMEKSLEIMRKAEQERERPLVPPTPPGPGLDKLP
jgi:hypothetical protein